MYALFGFLGILLLLAGLLPIRALPGFLRGRPRKERRAMWVSGLIIVLIAGAFTPSDDESQQEVVSNESKAAAAADPVATTSPLPQPAADGTPETTSRPTASPPRLHLVGQPRLFPQHRTQPPQQRVPVNRCLHPLRPRWPQSLRGDESSLAGSIPVRLRQALRGNGLRLPVLGFVPGAGGSEGVIGADPVPDPRRPARSPASR